jgi:hypothetical protein
MAILEHIRVPGSGRSRGTSRVVNCGSGAVSGISENGPMGRRSAFIKTRIDVPAASEAELLIGAAEYHCAAARAILADAYTQEPAAIQLYAHLRAFFWELYCLGELALSRIKEMNDLTGSPQWARWWSDIGGAS